jgi:hypothetical protein
LQNLNRHLKEQHALKFEEWLSYKNSESVSDKTISQDVIDLVKYIVSSNTALAQLENEHFTNNVAKKVPSIRTFRHKFLREVLDCVFTKIESKLNATFSICLIEDLWLNGIFRDYIGIGAQIVELDASKKAVILG